MSTAEWRTRRGGGPKKRLLIPLFCRPQQKEGIAKHVLLLSCAKQQICFPLVNIRMSLFVASTSHLFPLPSQGYGQGVYECGLLCFFCVPVPAFARRTQTHTYFHMLLTLSRMGKKSIHVFSSAESVFWNSFFSPHPFSFLAIHYSIFYTTPPCYLFAILLCSSLPSARERWW